MHRLAPGSESTFPTQTRDTGTHRDRELKRQHPWRMALGKVGIRGSGLHLDVDLGPEILRKTAETEGGVCRQHRDVCKETLTQI